MTRHLALSCGLLAAGLFGLVAGHDWLSPASLWAALSGDPSLQGGLILHWRLPRVLAAGLVGALLGTGGAIFQGVFRNPLAEPYLLGTAGGGVAADLAASAVRSDRPDENE